MNWVKIWHRFSHPDGGDPGRVTVLESSFRHNLRKLIPGNVGYFQLILSHTASLLLGNELSMEISYFLLYFDRILDHTSRN